MEQVSEVDEHAETLAQEGIVVIEDYLDADVCDRVRSQIEERIEGDTLQETTPEWDYLEKVNADEPVMDVRSGSYDQGMLDVYNVELIAEELESVKEDEFVLDVVETATGEDYVPLHINGYVNKSVTETRPYHADTYGGLVKAFVYLTDVPDRSYGPFSYVPGSNDPSFFKRKATEYVNKYKGNPRTDAIFFEEDEARVCTAPKGTLIISDQSGYHRGIPQAEGKERMLVNTQYQPASDY